MARQVTILRVFVASPQDVMPERAALEQVIRELNMTWSQTLGIHLELVRWETHAYPGIGVDAQTVINDQIGEEYEIFIGILFTRFGTPTGRAASGTAEEYEAAYERFQRDRDQLRVMVYFKDGEVKPSELDLNQYAAVKEFQQKLGEKGTLYWTFPTTDDFVALARMHLSRQVQDWGRGWGTRTVERPTSQPAVALNGAKSIATEEEGLLDLIESGQENLANMAGSTEHMTEALQELTDQINENLPEFNDSADKGDMKRAKRVTNSVASFMEQYACRMELELPNFARASSTGIDAIARASTLLTTDFHGDNTEDSIRTVFSQLQTLTNSIAEARVSMASMRDTVLGLPRLTTTFNRAKKHMLKVLNDLDEEMAAAINLTSETGKELSRILEQY